MHYVDVEVQEDHIERLIQGQPINAIAELIWNGFDADAHRVDVDFEAGPLTALGTVRVTDNGTGIPYDKANELFKGLGGSWKARQGKTQEGRLVHGEKGQGRFKAFLLGSSVVWRTHSATESGQIQAYEISGHSPNRRRFSVSAPVPASGRGTVVEITGIQKDFKVRTEHGADVKIRDIFALQLYQDPAFDIFYDGLKIDARGAISSVKEYSIEIERENDIPLSATVSVVEWKNSVDRKLMLCLPGGFPFHDLAPGIRARGFEFTAYLTADHFRTLVEENREGLVELDGTSQLLIEAAKDRLREHFRERETERSRDRIDEWKKANIYPYTGDPVDPIERNERSVFNIVALNLTDYSSDFDKNSPQTQKLIMQLVKAAIETGPGSLPQILEKVIGLPRQKLDDLADLLRKASLTSIINAARAVTDRLDFLKALQLLVFDPKSKKQLLERTQLHRIIAQHTWIFGEQFNLVSDDEDLTTVLERHVSLLDLENEPRVLAADEPVLDAEGKARIVDLMLSRRVPLAIDEQREHLIVELKRPSVKVSREGLSQISNYAITVANDERFKGADVRWNFVIVSNGFDDYVAAKAKQRDRPPGLVDDMENPHIRVWVKTWAQIIQEAEGRLTFYRRRLEYSANDDEALRYLRQIDEKFLSPAVLDRIRELPDEVSAQDHFDDTTQGQD